MANATKKSEKRKRRSISALSLVRAIKAEVVVTGLTENSTVGELLDAIKDNYFADNG